MKNKIDFGFGIEIWSENNNLFILHNNCIKLYGLITEQNNNDVIEYCIYPNSYFLIKVENYEIVCYWDKVLKEVASISNNSNSNNVLWKQETVSNLNRKTIRRNAGFSKVNTVEDWINKIDNFNPYYEKNEPILEFCFTIEHKSFQDFAKFSYNQYNNQLYLTLPVGLYVGNYGKRELILKSKITTDLTDIGILKEMSNDCFSCSDFFDKYFPKSNLLNKLWDKSKQWLSTEIRESTLIKETNYICGEEFIAVDDNSSFYGNFIQDNIEGCHLSYGENNNTEDLPFSNLLNYSPDFCTSILPKRIKDIDKDIYNKFYEFSKEEKLKYIEENLTIDEIVKLYQNTLIEDASSFVENYYPYQVKLSGNDDDSWTKYFTTEESMMNEVYRLRRTQPINKELDVQGCGYIFTN